VGSNPTPSALQRPLTACERPFCVLATSSNRSIHDLMSIGPRQRRPIKVVAMVIVYWVGGNVLQSVLGWLLVSGGLLDAEMASRAGLILGWGLLFVVSLIFRERLDDWLRS
jgi:hypothetical protein